MSALEVARANEKLKELNIPGARIAEVNGRPELRWRLFARLELSVDGTTENGLQTEAPLATAYTWPELLEKAHAFAHDEKRQAEFVELGRNRLLRGLPLEPLPETPEQRARSEETRARMKLGRERVQEGMRRHVRGMLEANGMLELAKRYHKRTGRLAALFGRGVGEWFDFGRKH
jgi:hypothetical protein